tara:strand:+ start:1209 stop:4259 length:3051 start_codon:yes stop_codon:yes gene_type:complete
MKFLGLRMNKAVALFFALSISIVQADDTGALTVTVTDSNGNSVSSASVSASTSESLRSGKGNTGSDGSVRLSFLDPSSQYEVNVSAAGFNSVSTSGITVVSGETRSLAFTVTRRTSDIDDVVVVASRESLIDTTSAQQGMNITLDVTESLPTGRSYQSYLQLAPSVKPSAYGDPSSKSGVNYSDAGGTIGNSTDNVYYIDGVNVTNVDSGTSNTNLNSEIIQEQQVLTGGLKAEYEGGSGLVSKVITKSGGNEFSGSINYYFQNDSLIADNDNLPEDSFNSFDTAITLGGPIIKDKVWFFASMQIKENEYDVSNLTGGGIMRTSTGTSDLGFGKITAQMTDNGFLTYSFFNDPYEKDASSSASILNNRDTARIQGGDNSNLSWTQTFENGALTISKSSHEGESSTVASDKSSRNNVAFTNAASATLAARNKGGRGSDSLSVSAKDEIAVVFDYYMSSKLANFDLDHDIKMGYTKTDNSRFENSAYTGDGSQYTSIGAADAGTTYAQMLLGGGYWNGSVDLSIDDAARVLTAGNAVAAFVTAYDTNADGKVSQAELNAAVFSTTAGNPDGDVNVYRINQTAQAPLNFTTEGEAFFIQDTISMGQWTFDLGVRAESYAHFGSDGSQIADFDWEYAPRMAATFDVNGDGRSKAYVFSGRYYDPIRTDMTGFAGTLAGSVREEQVYLAGDWLTFRTRGGAQTQDALFAPNTKTPYTDEVIFGYSQLYSDDMKLSVTYTERKTRDIMEDFGLYAYSCSGASATTVTPVSCPSYGRSVAAGGYGINDTDFGLPLSYFGYESYPASNYVIGTLKGAKRDYTGIEVAFTKRPTDERPFFILASYTNNDATGNSNSDGNADLQGDFDYLDPRAPNMYGPQPGNVEHQFKFAGNYIFTENLEAGAIFNWNSGALYNKATSVYRRYLPERVAAADSYTVGGLNNRWLKSGFGTEQAPAYYELDLRVKYTAELGGRELELFVDIFNVLDNQATTGEMGLIAGDGTYAFGESISWVSPRAFYLGARMSF